MIVMPSNSNNLIPSEPIKVLPRNAIFFDIAVIFYASPGLSITITMVRKTRLAFALLYISSLVVTICAFHETSGYSIGPSAYYGPPASNSFGYAINTTYMYTYNFTARNNNATIENKELWFPSLANRTLLDSSGKVYQQEFKILQEHFSPYMKLNRTGDANGNNIYYIKFNVTGLGTWSFDVKANFTLRQITWNPMQGITMASYNKTDALYKLYTKDQANISKSYPPIAAEAVLLNSTNPYTTVRNVYNFVSSYLTYVAMPGDWGAEYAIDHHQGDCTEFSHLMTALLRACGIPARVLRGIVIAKSSAQGVTPDFRAPVGASWMFNATYDRAEAPDDNLTGHAWCEYFIPNQGWITADPTWHTADNYTAKIDNVHVPYMVNLWIGKDGGPYPLLNSTLGITIPTTSISTIPFPMFTNDPFRYNIIYKFTVIRQEIPKSIWDLFLAFVMANPLLILGIILVILFFAIVAYAEKKRKAKRVEKVSYSRASFT